MTDFFAIGEIRLSAFVHVLFLLVGKNRFQATSERRRTRRTPVGRFNRIIRLHIETDGDRLTVLMPGASIDQVSGRLSPVPEAGGSRMLNSK